MESIEGKTIALTGATGFLGSHIALALLAAGARVRGVVRTPSKGQWLADLGVELVRADLGEVDALEKAFSGSDILISNAALAVMGRASWDAFYGANVQGSANVFQAAASAGVARAVHVSSIGVYSHRGRGAIDEDTALRQGFALDLSILTTNWRYSATKAMAEEVVTDICRTEGITLTIVRPGPIYGSRDGKMTAAFSRMVDRRFLPAPTARLPMIHAGDVAEAIHQTLVRPVAAGRAYNLAGAPAPLADVLALVRDLRGTPCRILRIPLPLGRDFDDGRAIRELGLAYRPLREGWSEALGVAAPCPT